MILERVFDSARHLLGEAIKVRSLPKKPAQGIAVTDAPKVGRPARSLDFSRLTEGGKRGPDASPLSRPSEASPWANWPVVATLTHVIAEGHHRIFGSGSRTVPEVESWITHQENPNAVAHPSKDRGVCGLCLSYVAQGRGPVAPQMVEMCPSCGGGGNHARDCDLVLSRDFGITDDQWTDLPGGLRWDEWADANQRRGFLL